MTDRPHVGKRKRTKQAPPRKAAWGKAGGIRTTLQPHREKIFLNGVPGGQKLSLPLPVTKALLSINLYILPVFLFDSISQKHLCLRKAVASLYLGTATFSSSLSKRNPQQTVQLIA